MGSSTNTTNTARSLIAPGFFLLVTMIIMAVIPLSTARSDSGEDYYYNSLFREAPENYEEKNVRNLDGIEKRIKSKIMRDDKIIYNDSEALTKLKFRKDHSSGMKTNGGLDIIGGGHLLRTVQNDGNKPFISKKEREVIRNSRRVDLENLIKLGNIYPDGSDFFDVNKNNYNFERELFRDFDVIDGENFLKKIKDETRKTHSSQNNRGIIRDSRQLDRIGGGHLLKKGKIHHDDTIIHSRQLDKTGDENLLTKEKFVDDDKDIINDKENQEFQGFSKVDGENFLKTVKDKATKPLSTQNNGDINSESREGDSTSDGNLMKQGKTHDDDSAVVNDGENKNSEKEKIRYYDLKNLPINYGFPDSIKRIPDNERYLDLNFLRQLDEMVGGNILGENNKDFVKGNKNDKSEREIIVYDLENLPSYFGPPDSIKRGVENDSNVDELSKINLFKKAITNLKRQLDQIGGGNLLKREQLNFNDGKSVKNDIKEENHLRNVLSGTIGDEITRKRRHLDSIGGGNLLKRGQLYFNDGNSYMHNIRGENLLRNLLSNTISDEITRKRRHLDKIGGGNLLKKRQDFMIGDDKTELRKHLLGQIDEDLFNHRLSSLVGKDDEKLNEPNIDKLYRNTNAIPESIVDRRRHVDPLGGGNLLKKRNDDIFWDDLTQYRNHLMHQFEKGNFFKNRQSIINDKDDGKFNDLNIDQIYSNTDKIPESIVDNRRHIDRIGGGNLL